MGQGAVLKVLEENKGWMLTGEIMEVLHESRGSINNALRALYKHGEIMRKDLNTRNRKVHIWKSKDTEDARNGSKKHTEKQ